MKRLLLTLACLGLFAGHADAAISRIGQCSAQTTSCTFSTAPSSGDYLIVFAHRDGSTTAPTLAGGYTSIITGSSGSGTSANSETVGYKVAAGTETTTTTWTNATSIAAVVLRGVSGIGASAQGGAASTTLTIPALTLTVTDGSSWVVGFAGCRTCTNANGTPAFLTVESSATDVAVSDSEAGLTSWAAASITVSASTQNRGVAVEIKATPSGATSAIVADRLVDCGGDSSANGTTITTTILGNCTRGKAATWTVTGTAATLTLQGTPTSTREGNMFFRETGASLVPGAAQRIIRYTPTSGLSHLDNDIPYATYWATRSMCVAFNVADDGASGKVFDLMRFDDTAGDWAVLQFNNGADGAGQGYAINLHTNPGGTTTISGSHTISVNSTHCFSLHFDALAHTASLYMYTSDWSTQEVHITASTNSLCSDGGNNCYVAKAYFGNVEVGTTTGSFDFWDIIDDYGTAADPLRLQSSWWGPKYCGNSASTSSTSMPTCAVSNVAAGDLGVALIKFESTSTTISSCSDGTSTWTVWSPGTISTTASSGEPHLVIAYKLGMVATGSVTLTCTLNASQPFLDIVVYAITPPTGTVSMSVDGSPVSGNSGSGTSASATTSNTTTATNSQGSLSFVGYSEYGATVQNQKVNGVHMDAFRQATSGGHSAAYIVGYTTGFTSDATSTLSAANRWDLGLINFKANASGGGGSPTCAPTLSTLGVSMCGDDLLVEPHR